MKELMRVTLDNRQVCEACEIAVRDRVSAEFADQEIRAFTKLDAATNILTVDVVITKKRAPRKPKAAA